MARRTQSMQATVGRDCSLFREAAEATAQSAENRQEQRLHVQSAKVPLNGEQGGNPGEIGLARRSPRCRPRNATLSGTGRPPRDDPWSQLSIRWRRTEAFEGLENATGTGHDAKATRGRRRPN